MSKREPASKNTYDGCPRSTNISLTSAIIRPNWHGLELKTRQRFLFIARTSGPWRVAEAVPPQLTLSWVACTIFYSICWLLPLCCHGNIKHLLWPILSMTSLIFFFLFFCLHQSYLILVSLDSGTTLDGSNILKYAHNYFESSKLFWMYWNNLKCSKHSKMIEEYFEEIITVLNVLEQFEMFETFKNDWRTFWRGHNFF